MNDIFILFYFILFYFFIFIFIFSQKTTVKIKNKNPSQPILPNIISRQRSSRLSLLPRVIIGIATIVN
jgi:hypothetical protein